MPTRYLFHLSIPVADLDCAKRFYVEVLCARLGRTHSQWLDVILWGHQLTLQHRPEETLPLDRQGKRHFGVVLPWNEWEDEVRRLQALNVQFLAEPAILLAGTAEEQAKFYLRDPSDNVIEVKAYRHPEQTLLLHGTGPDTA